jgi:hypothetical protein
VFWEQGILEQPMVDLALAEAFEEQRETNSMAVSRLSWLLPFAHLFWRPLVLPFSLVLTATALIWLVVAVGRV